MDVASSSACILRLCSDLFLIPQISFIKITSCSFTGSVLRNCLTWYYQYRFTRLPVYTTHPVCNRVWNELSAGSFFKRGLRKALSSRYAAACYAPGITNVCAAISLTIRSAACSFVTISSKNK